MFPIEKGIPIPPRSAKRNEWDFIDNMEIGDSFVVPDASYTNRANSSFMVRGMKMVYRKIRGSKEFRIWRVK